MVNYGRKELSFSFAATGTSSVDHTLSHPDFLLHSVIFDTPSFSSGVSGLTAANSGCSGVTIQFIDEDGFTLYTSSELSAYQVGSTTAVTGMDVIMLTGATATVRAQLVNGGQIVQVPLATENTVTVVLYVW